MKNIYLTNRNKNAFARLRFFSLLTITILLIAGINFKGYAGSAPAPAIYNVTGNNVCYGNPATIGLDGTDVGAIYHLLRTVDDVNYTHVILNVGQGFSFNFAVQTNAGKYEVWRYDAYTSNTTDILTGQKQNGEVYIYPVPTPTINGAATVCSGSEVTYSTESVDAFGNSFSNYSWNVTGGTINPDGTTTDNTVSVTWGTAGSGQVSVNYSTPGGECSAASATDFPVTIEATPVFTGVTLQYLMDPAGIATPVNGTSPDFSMCLHAKKDYIYLDVDTWTGSDINEEILNPFTLDQNNLPVDWLSYWSNKEVTALAASGSWQEKMYNIINGDAPIFYVYKTAEGDYQLIDGLMYQYAGTMVPLQISGDYPAGTYAYKGSVSSGTVPCESEEITINMEFNAGVWNSTQNKMYCAIEPAVSESVNGDVIEVSAGTYVLASQLNLNKSITLNGAGIGQTIITRGTDWSPATGDLGIAHLVGIGVDNVTVSNLTVTGAQKVGTANGSGINVYVATGVVFTNVESKDNQAAGFIVNGSSVTMNGVVTSGNGWYAANVGRGGGVTQMPSLVVDATTSFGEAAEIVTDADIPESNVSYGFKYVFVGGEIAYNIKPFDLSALTYATIERGDVTYIYLSLQAAINAASAGETVNASAGTFAENILLNKSVVLKGANANMACGSRGTESLIAPASGLPVNITADGVTINGFEITAPNNLRAVSCGPVSNIDIDYNNIHDIGNGLTGDQGIGAFGIVYQVPGTNETNIGITNNCLSNIGSSAIIFDSPAAIGILQSASTGTLTGLTIENNTIENVNVATNAWGDGGRIAYGIQINTGGSSSYLTTTGKVVGASIKNNVISGLEGFIPTGIALEGNTENAVVDGNTVSNLTGYKLADRSGGGYDLQALKFENNRYVGTVTVSNNSFQTETFAFNSATPNGLGYAVANYVPMVNGGIAELGCNWYGTASYGELVAEYQNFTGKIFNKEGAGTDFVKYSTTAAAADNCDGLNATLVNLVVNYDEAAERIEVTFDVDGNSVVLYPIPGLIDPVSDYTVIVAKYAALQAAISSGDANAKKAAALEIGDDIITEFYYEEGGNKIYLKTSNSGDLVKNKYWDKYLNNSGLGYPSFADNRFEAPAGSYSTWTSPATNSGGTVRSGWLAPVYGKDLHVDVTLLHNGEVSTITKSIAIDPAPVVNLNTGLGYMQIQTAINDPSTKDGHTIQVAAGTYTENVVVDKAVTIEGPQKDVDPRTAAALRTSGSSAEAIVDGGGSSSPVFEITVPGVVLNGLEITNARVDLVSSPAGDPVKTGVIVKYCIVSNSGDEGIQLRNVDGGGVEYCYVYSTAGDGINLSSECTNSYIKYNQITTSASADAAIYLYENGPFMVVDNNLISGVTSDTGIKIGHKDGNDENKNHDFSNNAIVSNNTVIGHSGSEVGIYVNTSRVEITDNTITNWESVSNAALYLRYDIKDILVTGNDISGNENGIKVSSGVSAANALTFAINGNNLSGNTTLGLKNSSSGAVDATCNWWGTTDPYAVEALTSGDVQFLSFLVSNDLNTPDCSGVGPVTVWDGAYTGIKSSHMTINAALNAAVTGDIVEVAAGTYNYESEGRDAGSQGLINVAKGVTLRAASGARPIIDGTGVDGVFKIHPAALNPGNTVVIEGFEITGEPTTGIAMTMQACYDVTPAEVIIRDNWFHGMIGGIDFWGATSYLPSGWTSAVANTTITGNKFYDMIAAGGNQGFGILIESPAKWENVGEHAVIIEKNEFSNLASDGTNYGTGIGIMSMEGEAIAGNVSITENSFTSDVPVGVVFANANVAHAEVTGNSFETSVVGINATALTNPPLNATCNWWNTVNGDDIPAKVSGDVDVSSWLIPDFEGDHYSWAGLDKYSCSGSPVVITLADATNRLCGSLGSIDLEFEGGVSPYDITWTGGSDIGISSPYQISDLDAGSYNITITDANGTSVSTSKEVLYQPVYNATAHTYHQTIMEAIGDATDGDVIEVCAGTYAEDIVVDKPLDIRGPNYDISPNSGVRVAEAIIVPADIWNADDANNSSGKREWNWWSIVTFNSDDVKMNGFMISGDNLLLDGYDYAGMDVEAGIGVYSEGNNIEFSNNIVENFTVMGFWAGGTQSTQYKNLVVDDNKIDKIHDVGLTGYGFGMYIQGTAGSITNNVVTNVRSGLQVQPYQVLEGITPSVVKDNSFSAYVLGLYYNYAEVNASAWTIQTNTIGVSAPPVVPPEGPLGWTGMKAETMRNTGNGGTLTSNIINGTGASVDNINWTKVWGMHYKGNASNSTEVYFTNNTVSNVEIAFVHDAPADIVFTGNNLSFSEMAISIQGANNVDATGGNTFNGIASSSATTSELFTIEDAIDHKIDESLRGLVKVKAGELYVTTNSFAGAETVASVQRGINAASSGWTVNVNDGTYSENPLIDKSLNLMSANGSSVTTISASGGAAITVQADAVEINGFTITNPDGNYAILSHDNNGLEVRNNAITGIGNNATSGNTHAIYVKPASEEVANVTIEDNTFTDIHGGENDPAISNGSASAIFIGDSNSAYNVTGLVIQRNTISNINASIVPWASGNLGGKGAYGVLIGVGASGSGQVVDPLISSNVISDLEGNWSHAIGLEGDTPGALVENNAISDLTDHKEPSDAVAVLIEDNASAGSVAINNNSFTNLNVGVWNKETAFVDATCNWWNSPTVAVAGNVTFAPFLSDGTDTDVAIGFQPDPLSCGSITVYYVNDNDQTGDTQTTAVGNDANFGTADAPFLTIQHAVDVVPTGSTIMVDAGTYQEQVQIAKSLDIIGAGKDVTNIVAPDAGSMTSVTWNNAHPVVYAEGIDNTVNISDLAIDGDGGRTLSWFIGALYYDAGGTFNNNSITEIHDAGGFTGSQMGHAFYALQSGAATQTLAVTNNEVSAYQKGGIYIKSVGTTATVTGNTVTGQNVAEVTAQNGICFLSGSNGTIQNNVVTNNIWNKVESPHEWTASGILLYDATATVSGNTLSGNEVALSGYLATGSTYGINTFSNNKIHVWLDAAADVNSGNVYDKYVLNNNMPEAVFGCIQYAVDEASSDDALTASAHHFEEQVTVSALNISLSGAGMDQTFIDAPVNMNSLFYTSYDAFPVVGALNDANLVLSGLTVDGLGRGNTNYKMMGVAFRNAGGEVSDCKILNIENTPFSGAQHGVSIYAYNDDEISRNIKVNGNYITNFQKNALALNAGETTPMVVNVTGNTIIGHGATTVTAQNGIQTQGSLITGSVSENNISGIAYDNTNASTAWVATSILNFYADLDITSNKITGSHMGIYNYDAPGLIAGNDLTIEKVGVYAFGILGTDPPNAVPQPYEELSVASQPTLKSAGTSSGTEISAVAGLNVAIDNNTVTFSGGDNTATYGIEVDAGWGPDDITVSGTGNFVSGFEVGFEIYMGDADAGVFTGVSFNNNSILDNTIGIRSNADYLTVDATCNWFGTTVASGVAALVSGDVNVTPWLIDGADGLGDVGFQPVVACDNTAPTVDLISPADGSLVGGSQEFIFDFYDINPLTYLELDIFRPGDTQATKLQFTVPADNAQIQLALTLPEVIDAGITAASYDPVDQKWTFTINTANGIWPDGETKFYMEVADEAGNQYGDMNGVLDNLQFVTYIFDNTAPELVEVSPAEGAQCLQGGNFVWSVKAQDDNLYELEVDHSMQGTIPEFSVYANTENPYGTEQDKLEFESYGVLVTYDDIQQKWTIDFGSAITNMLTDNGSITFYIVIKDIVGNQWGTMYGTADSNTFIYTFDKELPVVKLVGNNVVNLCQGETYNDLGATATDNCDGDITSAIVSNDDGFDANTPGTYMFTYNVTDAAGNVADEVTRTVIVEETPLAGILTKYPDNINACDPSDVSATLTPGAGGNGIDELEYSTDGGTTWLNYSSGDPISTVGLTMVKIRTQRMAEYCDASGYEEVSWIMYGTEITSGALGGASELELCDGGNPRDFSVGLPTGGDGIYTYQWEESVGCTDTWLNATAQVGESTTTLNFNPPALEGISSMCYRLKITDGCGNVGYSDTKTYIIVPKPISQEIVQSTEGPVCMGDEVSATFTGGSGGTGTVTDVYQFSIDGGVTWNLYTSGASILATEEGVNIIQIRTYRTATGSGCGSSTENVATWTVNPEPEVDIKINDVIATYGYSTEFCYGENIAVELGNIVTGVGPINLAWEVFVDGNITPDATLSGDAAGVTTDYELFSGILPAGVYNLKLTTLTDNNGCNPLNISAYDATITVNPLPTATISGTQSVCSGGSATLNVTLTGASPWVIECTDGIDTQTFNVTDDDVDPNDGEYVYSFDVYPTANVTWTVTSVSDGNGCTNVGEGEAKIYFGPITYLPQIVTCPNTSIEVPVTVESFKDVYDISLVLTYDATVMTYTGYTDYANLDIVNDITPSGSDNHILLISRTYNSGDVQAIPDGNPLLTLNFEYHTGNTTLDWVHNQNEDCEYSYLSVLDETGFETDAFCDSPESAYYLNGSISLLGGTGTDIATISDISTVTGTPIIIPVKVSYPDLVSQNIGSDVLTDAKISTTETFPVGTRIFDITYNGTSVLASPVVIGGESEVLLSEILGSAQPLLGHSGQTIDWEFFVDGISSEVTNLPVEVEALAYIDKTECISVMDAESFEVTFADVEIDEIADITACDPDDIHYSYSITYPLIENNGGERILNDSKITYFADAALTVPVSLPAGTVIELQTPAGFTRTTTLTTATDVVYASALITQQSDPSTYEDGYLVPLERTAGTDNWSVTIKNSVPGVVYVKVENIVHFDATGTNYTAVTGPHGTFDEYVFDTQDFKVNYVGAENVEITAISDISTVTGTPVIIPVTVEYPDLAAQNIDASVLTDAKISTTDASFPTGSRIFDITYNGTSVLNSDYDLTGKSSVLLSDILGTAATSLLGHSGLTVNWEVYVDGVSSAASIPVTVEALAYVDKLGCQSVMDIRSFTVNFADAALSVDASADACYNEALEFTTNITYPTILNVNTAVLADAKISATNALPTGAVIDWDYNNGGSSGSYELLSSTSEILLSTIVGGASPYPLQGHSGTDIWSFTITNAGLMTNNVLTVQSVAVLDGSYYTYAEDQVGLTINEEPMFSFGFNGVEAGHNASFEYCYDTQVGVTLFAEYGGTAPYRVTYTMNGGTPVTVSDLDAGDVIAAAQTYAAGTYNIVVTDISDANGCHASQTFLDLCTATIIVNPEPAVTVIPAEATCNGSANGSVTMSPTNVIATYNYTLEPGGYTIGNHAGNYTFDGLAAGTYSWTMTDVETTCETSGNVTVDEPDPISLSGTVSYYNNDNTLLTDVVVTLLEEGTPNIVATATTDANGEYIFDNVCPGIYDVELSTDKATGGINSTDAGQVNLWSASSSETTWPTIKKARFLAGDVNGDFEITSIDAFMIQKYYVNWGTSPTFDKPWEFWMVEDEVNTQPIPLIERSMQIEIPAGSTGETQDFYAMVSGDFNRSYYEGSSVKSGSTIAGSVNLLKGEELEVDAGNSVELPVKAVTNMEVGAISLILDYPNDKLEIEDVLLKGNADEPVLFSIFENQLRIGWNSVDPINLSAGETMLTVQVKVKSDVQAEESCFFGLVADPLVELADGAYNVIADATLKMDGIKLASNLATGIEFNMEDTELLMNCYPNPFNDRATIKYTLPQNGRVNLEVIGILGNRIQVISNHQQTAGEYITQLDGEKLVSGVYQVVLIFTDDSGAETIRTVRMIKQ